jgi:hypothetical protein
MLFYSRPGQSGRIAVSKLSAVVLITPSTDSFFDFLASTIFPRYGVLSPFLVPFDTMRLPTEYIPFGIKGFSVWSDIFFVAAPLSKQVAAMMILLKKGVIRDIRPGG